MTGTGVPNGDMPNMPQSPLQDGPAVTDADLEALLAGHRDVAPWLQPVADVLAALSTEPSPGELAGEARALAAYRRIGVLGPGRRAGRATAGLTSRLSTKAAAGATAAAVILGGAATAAYAGVLPAPIQRFAHDAIGAPNAPSAPRPSPARGDTAAPGQLASHGKRTAHAKPHSAARNRHGKGQPGSGQGQQGQGQQGQGQQGQGEGSRPGQRQPGTGQGWPGNGQGNPHAAGLYGNPHNQGQQRDPHPNAKPAPYQARHARPARHAPAADP